MALTTRLATAADYPVFARLFPELRVPDPTPSEELFVRNMVPRVLLLCEDDAAVGYAFWQEYGRTAHLINLVVDAGRRGRGAGGRLMAAVRDSVRRAGCTRWYLNVKRDNEPALRLYQRCGLRVVHTSWAMRITWARAGTLAETDSAEVWQPEPEEDAALAAHFDLPRERLAVLRKNPGTVLLALREQGRLAGFTAFDPARPGAYPIRVARAGLWRPLLSACRAHALERFDFLSLFVEGDAALRDALAEAGAETSFELVQMAASLEAEAANE